MTMIELSDLVVVDMETIYVANTLYLPFSNKKAAISKKKDKHFAFVLNFDFSFVSVMSL